VAIKPFLGGKLFKRKTKFPVDGPGTNEENDLARLTLRCILTNDTITATIPGLTTVHEVENAAKASYMRSIAMAQEQKDWVGQVTEDRWGALPREYAWLRQWEIV
jgi:hypothetical protein